MKGAGLHRVDYEWAFLATILASRPQRVGRRTCLLREQAGDARSWRKLMFYRGMTCETSPCSCHRRIDLH